VTLERDQQQRKDLSQRRSTDDGMVIDESDEQPTKTSASIQESFEPDSNLTLERDEQSLKDFSQSRSTEDGMVIDDSDEQS
jgi:hypothetical protein